MKVSIIILNYNTKNLLKNCLVSLKGTRRLLTNEVIVVDNGSVDGSEKMIRKGFSWVKLIKNKNNLGFGKANNIAAKKAKGEYFLFLNSDTKLNKNTITKSLHFMEANSNYDVLTCRLELGNGKLDFACHRGFPTPWASFCYFIGLEKLPFCQQLFGQYHQTWKDFEKPHQVDVISGAFFLIKKDVFKKLKGFDEEFFIYGEDIDLCYRLKQQNYQVGFYPQAKAIHYKKRSGRKKRSIRIRKKTKMYFYQTMKLFYDKHYKNKYSGLIRYLVLLGIKVISLFKN